MLEFQSKKNGRIAFVDGEKAVETVKRHSNGSVGGRNGQKVVEKGSNFGRMSRHVEMVKYVARQRPRRGWAEVDWSNTGRALNTGQTLVKHWSNTGQKEWMERFRSPAGSVRTPSRTLAAGFCNAV